MSGCLSFISETLSAPETCLEIGVRARIGHRTGKGLSVPKLAGVATTLLLLLASPVDAQVLGPDADACRSGEPSVLVNVSGFKNGKGRVRVQLYGDKPADFLAKGKKLRRVDLPVNGSRSMAICVAVPEPGRYAIAVRHDANGSGSTDWNDGGGFSRNPPIKLLRQPQHSEVVFSVGRGVTTINITLLYRQGLSVRPYTPQ